jgi:hypothetical protein
MNNPSLFLLFFSSILIGSVCAMALIWLFGIEISELERFSQFPEKWTVLEFIWNATAGIILIGSIRAVYVALHGHYYGEPSNEPPNPDAGWGK